MEEREPAVQVPLTAAFERERLSLARVRASADEPMHSALRRVGKIASEALEVERFGVWLCTEDRTAIRLHFLCDADSDRVSEGIVLHVEDFPEYFTALLAGRAIAVEDSELDPAANDLRDSYCRPLGVRALLDAPLYRGGRVAGVVCHEHIGTPREWSGDDRAFAASVADTVSRLFEECARLKAERSLEAYQRELMHLSRLEGMGRLASGVAHDFGNLLTVMAGNLDLLSDHRLDAEDREALATMRDAVKRGRRLTQDLLHFGRDSGDRPGVHSVEPIVASVVRMAQRTFGAACPISVHATTATSRVFVDRAEMERVILNLLLNARDAMNGAGAITVEISEAEHTVDAHPAQRYVSVSVRDAGRGMDEATRARIFSPFFTTKSEGNGLGLAIAQQIVTRAGGAIAVDTTPGNGTAMTVLLPPVE